MAHMILQRYTTAIREAYAGGGDPRIVGDHLAEARRARAWLESLEIDPRLRASLIEPVAVLEEAFAEVQRTRHGDTGAPR